MTERALTPAVLCQIAAIVGRCMDPTNRNLILEAVAGEMERGATAIYAEAERRSRCRPEGLLAGLNSYLTETPDGAA